MKLTEEQSKLVEDNYKLVYKYCMDKNLEIEEWYDLLLLELCEKIHLYNPQKGSIGTFIYTICFNKVRSVYNGKNTKKRSCELESMDVQYGDRDNMTGHDLIGSVNRDIPYEYKEIINDYLLELDKKEKLMILLVLSGHSILEASRKSDVNRGISNKRMKELRRRIKTAY